MKKSKRKLNLITSWDDGHVLDFEIAKLLKKYKLPGIFYIPLSHPNHEVMDNNSIRELSKDFEIGAHGVGHRELTKIRLYDANKEILVSKKRLESIIEKNVSSFCYPRGRYNREIKQLLFECGFKEARTVDVFNIQDPIDAFETKPTIHIYPFRKEYEGKSWVGLAMKYLDQAIEEGGYFHLWGHSWEVNKYELWDDLDKFLNYLSYNYYEDLSS